MENKNLAILILAAGSSSRLGQPKQLLKHEGYSLLQIAVKKALNFTKDIYVVLGSEKDRCEKELAKYKVNIIFNKDYEKGMGSSISCGIKYTKDFENTMIILCDQPFIPTTHLNSLIENINDNNIITSLYIDNLKKSVPAIFPKVYYSDLEKLDKDYGAKYLLQDNKTIDINLEKRFAVDIDTIEDVNRFLIDES